MYVNRLIEFAEKNAKKLPVLGYKKKKINWIVDINKNSLTFSSARNKEYFVPDVARASNARPILLADKPDYVFGLYEDNKHKARSVERQEIFISLLKEYVLATGDEDVKHLIKLLKKPINNIPDDMRINHFVIFRIRDEQFLHDKKTVIDYWEEHIKSGVGHKVDQLACMFCHTNGPMMQRHTIDFLIGPNRTKMISANDNAYESQGLKHSHIAPTCFECEQKYGKALQYLLLRYKDRNKVGGPHMFRLGDVTYVYWLRDQSQLNGSLTNFVSPTDQQTAQDMKDLLNQAFQGIRTDREIKNFCLLALSSNKARLVVRDYIEDSAGKIKDRIEIFFKGQDVGQERFYGIYTLAATMYTEPRNQMQKYAIEEWTDWFLHGRRMSGRVLIPILNRIQSTGTMYPQHGAAIKSWLTSQGKGRRWTVELDTMKRGEAYVTGKVFAILERIQRRATNTDASISSKFFGSASTTPRSVMGLLIRNSQHHLNKLHSSEQTKKTAYYLEKKLGETLQEIQEFPATLVLEKQAEFALGYYHQRQEFYKSSNGQEEKGEN